MLDEWSQNLGSVRRGVDIEISYRPRMIELATGQPLDDVGMLAMERGKGSKPSS